MRSKWRSLPARAAVPDDLGGPQPDAGSDGAGTVGQQAGSQGSTASPPGSCVVVPHLGWGVILASASGPPPSPFPYADSSVPSCERPTRPQSPDARSSRHPLPERRPATVARPPRPLPCAWPSAWWTLHHVRGDAWQFGAQPRNRVPRAGGVGVQRRRTAIRRCLRALRSLAVTGRAIVSTSPCASPAGDGFGPSSTINSRAYTST